MHKLPEFKGKTAKFKKSVQCLDNIDFHILEQLGINISFDSDEDRIQFENSFNNGDELQDDQQVSSLSQIDVETADVDLQVTLEAIELPEAPQ